MATKLAIRSGQADAPFFFFEYGRALLLVGETGGFRQRGFRCEGCQAEQPSASDHRECVPRWEQAGGSGDLD